MTVKKTKYILPLDYYLEIIGKDLDYSKDHIGFCASNLDDIFILLANKGVKEIRVSISQMILIALFVACNISNKNNDEIKWDSLEILREGKIDKFLGIKLIVD